MDMDVSYNPMEIIMENYHRERAMWREMLLEISVMVGSLELRQQLQHIARKIKIAQMRVILGRESMYFPDPIHFAFLGKPGTGKSYAAQTIAKTFYLAGATTYPTCVEIDFYETDTEMIMSGMGGVLLVDVNALIYEITLDPVVIETILSLMDTSNTAVIFAGAAEHVLQFLALNWEVAIRIPQKIRFRSFTCDDIVKLLRYKVLFELSLDGDRTRRLKWDPDCTNERLANMLNEEVSADSIAMLNGHMVDWILIEAIRNLKLRTEEYDREAKVTVNFDDIEIGTLLLFINRL